jgi:hypothetical protein
MVSSGDQSASGGTGSYFFFSFFPDLLSSMDFELK